MDKLQIVCSLDNFDDWRGLEGTYFIACLFSVVIIFNIVLLTCVIAMKTNSKVSKIFLAKYFAGNIMAAFAQVYGCTIMIKHRKLTCVEKAVCYFSHQIGLMVSLTSLLVLTLSHYNYLTKRHFITPLDERRILRKSVLAAFLLEIIGIAFVCIPIFYHHKISLGLSLSFLLGVQIFNIGTCCFVQWKVLRRRSVFRFNIMRLKMSFGYLNPVIWATTVPRIIFVFLQYPLYYDVLIPKKILGIAARWIGISYFISFIILPILIIVKNQEIRKTFVKFAEWIISINARAQQRNLQICERTEEMSAPVAVIKPGSSQNTKPTSRSTWV